MGQNTALRVHVDTESIHEPVPFHEDIFRAVPVPRLRRKMWKKLFSQQRENLKFGLLLASMFLVVLSVWVDHGHQQIGVPAWIALTLAVVIGITSGILSLNEFRHGRKMIKRIEEYKPLFYANSVGNVGAICTANDFDEMLKKFDEQKTEKPWERVELYVPQTFTFSTGDDVKVKAHTGGPSEKRAILDAIRENIQERFGKDVPISYGHLAEALDILIAKDKRLFVPYSGSGTSMKPEEQWKVYGKKTPEEAKDYLLKNIAIAFKN